MGFIKKLLYYENIEKGKSKAKKIAIIGYIIATIALMWPSLIYGYNTNWIITDSITLGLGGLFLFYMVRNFSNHQLKSNNFYLKHFESK